MKGGALLRRGVLYHSPAEPGADENERRSSHEVLHPEYNRGGAGDDGGVGAATGAAGPEFADTGPGGLEAAGSESA
jgi:hypothetical protein